MNYVIYGSGGLAKELIGYITQRHDDGAIAYVVSNGPFKGPRAADFNTRYTVLARDPEPCAPTHVRVLAVATPWIKEMLAGDRWSQLGGEHWSPFSTYIHPTASVSPLATIGAGCFIGPHCVIAGDAILGRCVTVNIGSFVGHDATVGDLAVIGPGTSVCGGAVIGVAAELYGVYVKPGAIVPPRERHGAGTVMHRSRAEDKTW